MSEVIFIGPLELNPGVKGVEVEKYWMEEYLPNVTELPGYKVTLHKGSYGKSPGQYLYIGHFDSEERLAQLCPTPPDGGEEWNQWVADNTVWQTLMSHFDYGRLMAEFTNYVELD